MSDNYFKYIYKVIIVGDPAVGKSCILNRFLNNKFNEEYEITVGVEFGAKTILLEDGERIKLQIWDTAGQETFKSITRAYYRSAAIAILVYDITNEESFKSIENWISECRTNGNPEMTLVLAGNKIDIEEERMINKEKGENLAKENNMLFYETSAKNDGSISELFFNSSKIITEKIKKGEIDPANESSGVKPGTGYIFGIDQPNNTTSKKRKCCS